MTFLHAKSYIVFHLISLPIQNLTYESSIPFSSWFDPMMPQLPVLLSNFVKILLHVRKAPVNHFAGVLNWLIHFNLAEIDPNC